MDDKDKLHVIRVLSALVSIGVIGLEEFTLAIIGVEDGYITEENVSESFLDIWFESVCK